MAVATYRSRRAGPRHRASSPRCDRYRHRHARGRSAIAAAACSAHQGIRACFGEPGCRASLERGRIPIYYSRREPHRYVSAIDVLIGKVDPLLLRDKLVLVGATGIGLGDYHATPLGQFVPGAEIHAQVLENLYDHTWLARPPWAPATELGGFLLLGALLLWATPRWKPRNAAVLALVCIAVPALFA